MKKFIAKSTKLNIKVESLIQTETEKQVESTSKVDPIKNETAKQLNKPEPKLGKFLAKSTKLNI